MPGQTILISGAGIAGPTLAYWLRRRGFTPVLIERAARFQEGGHMIDFWGVGFDVAERMGLIPALRETGYFIDRVEFVAADGGKRSSIGGNLLARTLGDRFLSILRGDLAEAIYALVRNGVETIFGDRVMELTQNEGGVEVRFGRGRGRSFDLVIGADGLHSGIRANVFGPREKFERYLGYYAASFLADGYPKRDEHSYISYAAPGRQINRYALRGDRSACLLVFESQEKITGHPKQVLRETFSREPWVEWPQIDGTLEAADDVYFDAVSQIELPRWSQGRCALVGDAAYCPSLLAGEGTSFAMAGAYILAAELERAGGDYRQAFLNYEKVFRPFIERKQKSARAFASSFAPKTRFGLFARDQVLRLSSLPRIGEFLMRRFVTDRFVLPE